MEYTLPSPVDKSFLTNVFDDIEVVGDCLGVVSIAQQPEKKEKGNTCLGRQAGK